MDFRGDPGKGVALENTIGARAYSVDAHSSSTYDEAAPLNMYLLIYLKQGIVNFHHSGTHRDTPIFTRRDADGSYQLGRRPNHLLYSSVNDECGESFPIRGRVAWRWFTTILLSGEAGRLIGVTANFSIGF